jgi:type I restriction enzyme S subunit
MEEKAAEPAIRFAEFAGAWEQRKLGELYEKAGSGGTPNASNASFYMGTIPFLGISDIKGRYITKTAKHISEKGLKSSAAWMVPSGAISLAMYASVGKVGITSVELATSQAFYNMVFASSSLRNFIFSRLEKASDNDEWLPLVSTGTQSNLNADKIKNWCISVPNSNEQKLVGEFFKKLDNLLTLHQRKYEKLLNIKKSMLEKMFPKEGEVVPEIRFKGFTGAWEERKLGDIADITGGGTPSTSNNDYWDGIINWYSPAEISNQIFLNSSQRKITELGYSSCSAKMLPRGTVLFTSRAGIGKTAILSAEGCTNQGFQSIVPHANELDSYFIFSRTHELKKYGEVVGAGSTFVEVSGKQMAAMTLMMPPKFNEQKMIGDFFKRLDSILTLHQRKLEMLKNIKQAFLDKMFV